MFLYHLEYSSIHFFLTVTFLDTPKKPVCLQLTLGAFMQLVHSQDDHRIIFGNMNDDQCQTP